jgi:hypothetical protein
MAMSQRIKRGLIARLNLGLTCGGHIKNLPLERKCRRQNLWSGHMVRTYDRGLGLSPNPDHAQNCTTFNLNIYEFI